jgi:chemotaxis response regulator CheB
VPAVSGAPPAAPDAKRTGTRVLLATSDQLFAALCQRALAGTKLALVAAVAPPELLETARRLTPELLILDTDGEDVAALKLLATKVMLVSDARVVLVSAYLAPGSPGLCALLQSIAATFVQKPEGPSSLSLTQDDGPPFVAALQAAFAAHDNADLTSHPQKSGGVLPVDFDAGWGLEDESSGR